MVRRWSGDCRRHRLTVAAEAYRRVPPDPTTAQTRTGRSDWELMSRSELQEQTGVEEQTKTGVGGQKLE